MLLLLSVITMAQTPGLRKVTLQLKWLHQFQFAGYYAAIEKGFYAAEGLDVKLLEYDENSRSADAVFDGRAEFGVSNTDVILMKDKGRGPVVLAAIFQHSPLVLAASLKAGITHVHHLKGKKIAIEDYEGGLLTYLASEGLPANSFTRIKHNYSIEDLLTGKVDATTVYITDELYELDKAGFKYTLFNGRSANIDFYGDVLYTSGRLMEEDPELVEKFRRASVKGWRYAMANSDEIIDIILAKYSKRKTRDHLKFEASQMRDHLLTDVVEPGYFSRGRWESILDTYKKAKLASEDLTIEGMLYTDYTEGPPLPWGIILTGGSILLVSWVVFFVLYRSRRKYIAELATNQKLAAEMAMLNAEKDKFFSIIAHDLKNPFMGLLNLTTMLEEELDSLTRDEVMEMAGHLRVISEQTYILLTELLDWARIKRGQMDFAPEAVDIQELAADKLSMVKSQADAKGITLNLTVTSNPALHGDRQMIGSVLLNLLTNAIKFTKKGGTVELSAEEGTGMVDIHVKDSGIGIPHGILHGLFSIEEKTGRSGTEGESSTGLGLLLCKEFVEKHGGTIGVTSTEGKGSDFHISIPAGVGNRGAA